MDHNEIWQRSKRVSFCLVECDFCHNKNKYGAILKDGSVCCKKCMLSYEVDRKLGRELVLQDCELNKYE